MTKSEDYITASTLAKMHGLTMSTVRRRIQEGELFKGAKKEKLSFGEVWKIPRSEAEAVTLKELSPRLYQYRQKNEINSAHVNSENQLLSHVTDKLLEERVSRLERLFLKYLDQENA